VGNQFWQNTWSMTSFNQAVRKQSVISLSKMILQTREVQKYALCAILRQLSLAQPQLLHDSILNKINTDGSRFTDSFHDLWDMLTDIAADEDVEEIVCTLGASDALDEFRDHDRSRFIHAV
jgi:hypothetical protein